MLMKVSPVSQPSQVTITASGHGISRTATINLNP
jgi:hypothetical protein